MQLKSVGILILAQAELSIGSYAIELFDYFLYDLWPVIAVVAIALAYLLTQFEPPPRRILSHHHFGPKQTSRQYLSEFALTSLLSLDESIRQVREKGLVQRLRQRLIQGQGKKKKRRKRAATV